MGRDPQGLGNLWNWSVAPSPVGGQDVDAGFDGAQAGQVDVLEGEVRRGGGGGQQPLGGAPADQVRAAEQVRRVRRPRPHLLADVVLVVCSPRETRLG